MKLYGMFLSIWIAPCAPAQILDSFVLISSIFIGLAFSKARASSGSPETGGAEVRCVPCSAWTVSPLNEAYPWPLWERASFFAPCFLFSLLPTGRSLGGWCARRFWRKPGELRFLAILTLGSRVDFIVPPMKRGYLPFYSLGAALGDACQGTRLCTDSEPIIFVMGWDPWS